MMDQEWSREARRRLGCDPYETGTTGKRAHSPLVRINRSGKKGTRAKAIDVGFEFYAGRRRWTGRTGLDASTKQA